MRFSKILAVLMFTLAFGSKAYAGLPVPELDPSTIGSACLLIGGTALIIRAQRAKK
jgi:hypothetical protein